MFHFVAMFVHTVVRHFGDCFVFATATPKHAMESSDEDVDIPALEAAATEAFLQQVTHTWYYWRY